MSRRYESVLGYVVVLLAAAGAVVAPVGAQDFEWSASMERGQTLEVIGISGEIRAVRAEGGTAAVSARKTGRRGDFEDVEIEVMEDGDGIVVCVLYAGRGRRNSCDYEDRGSNWADWGRRSIDVSVDFEVSVPAGVEFIGSMVSGDVEARDLASEVTATSVSGDIYVSTTGVAWGTTVSGDIDIEMGSSDWDDLHFSTVSGDITLTLPPGIDTEVAFESLSGDFRSDFDVRVESRRERWIGTRFLGTIGDGSRQLSFNTVSGDVRLREAR